VRIIFEHFECIFQLCNTFIIQSLHFDHSCGWLQRNDIGMHISQWEQALFNVYCNIMIYFTAWHGGMSPLLCGYLLQECLVCSGKACLNFVQWTHTSDETQVSKKGSSQLCRCPQFASTTAAQQSYNIVSRYERIPKTKNKWWACTRMHTRTVTCYAIRADFSLSCGFTTSRVMRGMHVACVLCLLVTISVLLLLLVSIYIYRTIYLSYFSCFDS